VRWIHGDGCCRTKISLVVDQYDRDRSEISHLRVALRD
jgi:hypothetical protein